VEIAPPTKIDRKIDQRPRRWLKITQFHPSPAYRIRDAPNGPW
jgi:hypothetical protein